MARWVAAVRALIIALVFVVMLRMELIASEPPILGSGGCDCCGAGDPSFIQADQRDQGGVMLERSTGDFHDCATPASNAKVPTRTLVIQGDEPEID